MEKYCAGRSPGLKAGIFLCLAALISFQVFSQDSLSRKFRWKGYLSDLQMVQVSDIEKPWVTDNEFHNRLDLSWKPAGFLGVEAGMRNRFLFGQSLQTNPAYRELLFSDNGLIGMTWNIASGSSYALVSQFDRAFITISHGKAELTAGRQRINWGQAIVWNPNDIFNTYSWYDFDYPERPGSDALRLQYYPSGTSAVELAAGWNAEGRLTMAGLGRFNTAGYDIQFLAGLADDRDYVAGAGWSGNLAGAAFRGEVTYYHPKKNCFDTAGTFLATIGADYTFPNSLYLALQVFYNQLPGQTLPADMVNVVRLPTSPKMLSFTPWNLFLSGSYPVTPLFSVTLSGIWFPDMNGYFLGPTLQYSPGENFDLDLFIQYFNGRTTLILPPVHTWYYFSSFTGALRLKWNF